jgi:hypothetical protein
MLQKVGTLVSSGTDSSGGIEMADPSALQVVWPGISALLGAGIGGGATVLVNRQTNKQQRAAAFSSRQSQIKDRSFDACVDVLKTALLLCNEANILWYDPATGDSDELNSSRSAPFYEAARNHNAASSLARMAMPPMVKSSFDDYMTAVAELDAEIYNFKVDSGDTPISGEEYRDKPISEEEYGELVNDVKAKRDHFVDAARTQFNEGAWPDAGLLPN